MRKLIITGLIAAVAVPAGIAPAAAQSRAELRRDRQEVRDNQRDLDRAQRYGSRRDVREAREELREARQEYREDRRDRYGNDDWRGWRNQNRALYSRGNWRAPFRYQSFRNGGRIGAPYYAQRYWITDPGRYRLPAAYGTQRWARHYDDLLLVDTRRGSVIRVIRGFYW